MTKKPVDAPLEERLELVKNILPQELSILPVFPRPVFPEMRLPISFIGEVNIKALNEAQEKYGGIVGLVLPTGLDDSYRPEGFYDFGCAARIVNLVEVTADYAEVLMDVLHRFQIEKKVQHEPFERWRVIYEESSKDIVSQELRGYLMAVSAETKELVKYNSIFQEQLRMTLSTFNIQNPSRMLDTLAFVLAPESERLQEILEAYDLVHRANLLLKLLREDIEIAKVQEKIASDIDKKATDQQREYFLREQLKAIKKELGIEKEDKESDVEKILQKVEKLKLSEEAQHVVDEEISKLKLLNVESPEYAVARNYLEVITALPWGIFSEDCKNLKQAREILDREHYGLKDVKELILEFLNSILRKGSVSGSIICLVGPPGVGKTSVGKSIAHALERKFFRFSVGGMRDEAEIKGHRRTYIGAMPGKIIQALKRVKTSNPVIMLDEIDKVGSSFQGDPASALLEVLDPEQNQEFLDHYLDVAYDLSNILFITTANQLDTIPRPLQDRMEVIKLPGYVAEEKLEIAVQYLIPKQLKENGFTEKEIIIPPETLRVVTEKYARQAGVRDMEKAIRKLIRKAGLMLTEGKKKKIRIDRKKAEEFLGKPLFKKDQLYRKPQVGVVLGLAYTAYGGATLYVEASGVAAKSPFFRQTGKLGEVMKESSQIAYSFAHAYLLEEEPENRYFETHEIHLHVPEGATPKDGPSAGITMALALYSLAKGLPVRHDLAMTGELTLTGKILPIGGVKEKVIAARRAEIKHLIFPSQNRKDVEELEEYVRKGIDFHYAEYFKDLFPLSLQSDL